MTEPSKTLGPALGAVIGVAIAWPMAIPLWMTILLLFKTPSEQELLFAAIWLALFTILPVLGMAIGTATGHLAQQHGVRLYLPSHRVLSVAIWTLFIPILAAVDIGFVLSPLTLIGLGNTSTAIDLWIFPISTGILGAAIGVLLASILLLAVSVLRVVRTITARLSPPR